MTTTKKGKAMTTTKSINGLMDLLRDLGADRESVRDVKDYAAALLAETVAPLHARIAGLEAALAAQAKERDEAVNASNTPAAEVRAAQGAEPVAWGVFFQNGQLYDPFREKEDAEKYADESNGEYVGPLYSRPPAAEQAKSISANIGQLREAIEILDVGEPDANETELVFEHLPARVAANGEPMEAGLYVWLSECPEEGCIGPLTGDDVKAQAEQAEALKASARYRWLREHGDDGLTEKNGYGGKYLKLGDDLDAAIDAAIASAEGGV